MAKPVNHPLHFVLSKTYTEKCAKHNLITKENLDLSGIGFEDKIAYILNNVLTQEECNDLIKETESAGYKQALIHAGNVAVLAPGYRDSKRVMIDDTAFVSTLFKRIGHLLPQQYKSSKMAYTYKIKEINERLRFLKYGPKDKFGAHCDGSYTRPDGSAKTLITLHLYLNEGMEGGETTFIRRFLSQEKELLSQNRIPVEPSTGSILVFQHDIYHEGSEVMEGTKYTLRMDVLYEYDDNEKFCVLV